MDRFLTIRIALSDAHKKADRANAAALVYQLLALGVEIEDGGEWLTADLVAEQMDDRTYWGFSFLWGWIDEMEGTYATERAGYEFWQPDGFDMTEYDDGATYRRDVIAGLTYALEAYRMREATGHKEIAE